MKAFEHLDAKNAGILHIERRKQAADIVMFTGGYPRIFQLTEKSIAILAQKRARDTVKLKLIE